MFSEINKPLLMVRCKNYNLLKKVCSSLTKTSLKILQLYLFTDLYFSNGIITTDHEQLIQASIELGLEEFTKLLKGQQSKKTLLKDFERLLDEQLYCDFVIIVNKEKINCHKYILCARSELYQNMFYSIEENCTECPDLSGRSPRTIKGLLRYFYTDSFVHIDLEMAKELLGSSVYYALSDMKLDNYCEKLIKKEKKKKKKKKKVKKIENEKENEIENEIEKKKEKEKEKKEEKENENENENENEKERKKRKEKGKKKRKSRNNNKKNHRDKEN
ncbi:pep-cterm sorting domain-containing protein [Anaeramoeba flamelloides]|uniref:Pep-cterm sorting domain-containing protein n=1 Tax=Anaeramoeba flamelloides TaxID=1746091 RepID=A0AAV7Z1M5_9EUKA|nr:pep-cterm sorting domain-containing protein [Anaeramoeba flamelloides]